jgi:hypothetical protein
VANKILNQCDFRTLKMLNLDTYSYVYSLIKSGVEILAGLAQAPRSDSYFWHITVHRAFTLTLLTSHRQRHDMGSQHRGTTSSKLLFLEAADSRSRDTLSLVFWLIVLARYRTGRCCFPNFSFAFLRPYTQHQLLHQMSPYADYRCASNLFVFLCYLAA